METTRDAPSSTQPRDVASQHTRLPPSEEYAASIGPTPTENGRLERTQAARTSSHDGNINNRRSKDDQPPVPSESSAYTLLALMTSAMQQAAHASADERGRTTAAYCSSKAAALTRLRRDGGSDDDDTDGHHAAKKRKPTHTARKDEITGLHNEIAQLQQRLAFLRGQSILPLTRRRSQRRSSSGGAIVDDSEPLDDDPEHPHIPNALLRDAIHEQQLSLACARSMVSHFFMSDYALPAHCYIHLTTSRSDRLRTLQAVKPQQLRIARRYVVERSRHLNLTRPHAAGEQFMTENGDACTLRFSLVLFPGSVSVRQVFDATMFYASNLEISFTDGVGRLTIRENDDENDDPNVVHHRVLTALRPDLDVEANLVLFTHFDEDEGFGLVTSTFVDRDDLHPYNSLDRIRQDVTAVLMITREKDCVVMRRLGHVRIHHNANRPVSDELAKSLSESVTEWGNAVVKYAREQCGLDRP